LSYGDPVYFLHICRTFMENYINRSRIRLDPSSTRRNRETASHFLDDGFVVGQAFSPMHDNDVDSEALIRVRRL
jgi:hypothetical protein